MDWTKGLKLSALAYWYYRNILTTSSHPIERLSTKNVELADGSTVWEAYAYLSEKTINIRPDYYSLYGNAHGTGTHKTKLGAIHRAISEALERWAFLESSNSNHFAKYGFDLDPSSSGIAAYPSLTTSKSREIALSEAVERWGLYNWWCGNVSATSLPRFKDIEIITINTPFRDRICLVVYRRCPLSNLWAYGFACGITYESALQKAIVELSRNERVLLTSFKKTKVVPDKSLDLTEWRTLFFASQEGFDLFKSRLELSVQTNSNGLEPNPPALLVDTEIRGPWSKYAKVWRCVVENKFWDFERKTKKFFLF